MPPKQVLLGDDARKKILDGSRIVYEAVKSTYSPQSGNVAIQKQFIRKPIISHDGITVAREVILEDPVENMGAQLLIEASEKTNSVAGDGTSATVILAYHILEEANKRLASGFNAMGIRRGIQKAAMLANTEVASLAKPVDSPEQLEHVATISAGDPELGSMIADTIADVGENGGVTVQEYEGIGVISELMEGFHFNKGVSSPYLFTDQETREAQYTNIQVLVLEKRMSRTSEIAPIMEKVAKSENKKLLIIGDLHGDALNIQVVNKIKGNLDTVVVAPPVFGSQRTPFLEDIAELTGAKVIPDSLPANQVNLEDLGMADKLVATVTTTTIIGGQGDKEKVQSRIEQIKSDLKTEQVPARRQSLNDRLSKLSGKVGLIQVGAATESARKELKLRVDDAVHATRAAQEEGIVPGGATTLVRVADRIGTSTVDAPQPPDELEGIRIVVAALEQPFIQLMTNCGEDAGFRLHQIRKRADKIPEAGFNVLEITEEPINLLEAGIIDPAKVIKQVVENACSVAGTAITTNAAIAISPEEARKRLTEDDF